MWATSQQQPRQMGYLRSHPPLALDQQARARKEGKGIGAETDSKTFLICRVKWVRKSTVSLPLLSWD